MAISLLRIETEDPELINTLIGLVENYADENNYEVDTHYDIGATGSRKIKIIDKEIDENI